MRKPAFCIFLWPLCSDIIFFIDRYCAGVSNKHCLLPFFSSPEPKAHGELIVYRSIRRPSVSPSVRA